MEIRPLDKAVQPLKWLLGRWRSVTARGGYPTIDDFTYCEELTFESWGQPLLNYMTITWHPVKKRPMHLERGFLRIKPNTNLLALMVAHNSGLITLEEGKVNKFEINLESVATNKMSFAKIPKVVMIKRQYIFKPELCLLEYTMDMETCSTPLTNHLKASYRKLMTDYGK